MTGVDSRDALFWTTSSLSALHHRQCVQTTLHNGQLYLKKKKKGSCQGTHDLLAL